MVEARTKFIYDGSSEVKALEAQGVQTAGAGQEKDGLFCPDIAVGLCVRPDTDTPPCNHPITHGKRHPISL